MNLALHRWHAEERPRWRTTCVAARAAPIAALVLVLALPGVSHAQQESTGASDYETVVRAEPPQRESAQEKLDQKHPGFATVLEPQAHPGVLHPDDLPALLSRAPGVSVRSLGGLGQFSSLSLRGSSGPQVAVFLDGAPIDSTLGDLVSLGDLPLEALGQIEIYRGYIPVALGNRAIGGVLHLTHRAHKGPPAAEINLGYGTFNTRFASLRHQLQLSDHESLSLHLGYGDSDGDFPFFDHRGTLQYPQDDRVSLRTNNHYQRVLVHGGLQGQRGPWRYTVQTLLFAKSAGTPGPAVAQATSGRSENTTLRLQTRLRRRLPFPGGQLQVIGSASYANIALRDQDPSLGRFDSASEGGDFFLATQFRFPLWPHAMGELVADVRHELRDTHHAMGTPLASGLARRERTTYSAGLEIDQRAFSNDLQVVPSVRVEVNDNRFAVGAGQGEVNDRGRDSLTFGVAPRLAARYSLLPYLQLRASGGRYWRPPSVLELFGQQGALVGDPGLRAESGTTLDAGFLFTPKLSWGGLYAQAAGFATWAEDLITWVPVGARSRATNVEGAFVAGMEAGASLQVLAPLLEAEGSYTFLHSENRSEGLEGNPLPNRPQHTVATRVSSGAELDTSWGQLAAKLFYSLEYSDNNYQDLNARLAQAPRLLHGAGGSLAWRPTGPGSLELRLAAEVRNLTDERVSAWLPPVRDAAPVTLPLADFVGYPLPGRVVWISLTLTTRSHRDSP